MYELDFLIETFKEHSKECKRNRKKELKQFTENYPGEQIPDHMLEEFSLSEALHSICLELSKIKKRVYK